MTVLALTCGAYAAVSSAPFVYEDANWLAVIGGNGNWSLRLTNQLVGLDPRWFHLGNVAVHLVNGLLIYALVATVGSAGWALAAAGLFLLHPLQVETVAYVTERTELLSTTCVLLALYLGVAFTLWPWTRALLITGLAGWAVHEKVSAVVGLLLIPFALAVTGRTAYVRRYLVPGWAFLTLLLIGQATAVWRDPYVQQADYGRIGYALLQGTALVRYLGLWLVPYGFTLDHDWQIVSLSLRFLSGAVLLALAAFAWAARRRWPLSSATVGWVGLALLPRFLLRLPEVLNEHQLYLPSVGLSVWLGWFLARPEPV